MKKTQILLVAVVASMVSSAAVAQGFYLRLGLGYAFPQAGQTMYDTPTPYNGFPTGYNGTRTNTAATQVYNIKGASFSAGMQGSIGAGYMFNNNVGVQLDGAIGLGTKKYTFNDDNVSLNVGNNNTIAVNISTTQQAKTPFILLPSLVLQSGGDKVNVYSRFGLAVPLASKVTQDQVITNLPNTGAMTVDDFTWTIKNSFSLGFSAAAGVKYNINDRMSIWAELSILSMTVNAKEQDLKSWTENGQSVPLSNYSNAQKITFSKTATLDSNYSQFPTYSQPFSNIGINVGVTFNLSDRHSTGRRSSDNNDAIDNSKPYRRR